MMTLADQKAAVRASILSGTFPRLAWAHGDARAMRIVLGEGAETAADLERWRNLGRVGA